MATVRLSVDGTTGDYCYLDMGAEEAGEVGRLGVHAGRRARPLWRMMMPYRIRCPRPPIEKVVINRHVVPSFHFTRASSLAESVVASETFQVVFCCEKRRKSTAKWRRRSR
jgi:hypothetical protein